MTTEYDKEKAEKLFNKHIRRHAQRTEGYVISPEMLRTFRLGLAFARNSVQPTSCEGTLFLAAHSYTSSLDYDLAPLNEWLEAMRPDPPKPAWRIAADEAFDEGLSHSEVLDAIGLALAEDVGK